MCRGVTRLESSFTESLCNRLGESSTGVLGPADVVKGARGHVSDQSGTCRSGKRWSDSRYILKVEVMGFAQLNYCCVLLAVT